MARVAAIGVFARSMLVAVVSRIDSTFFLIFARETKAMLKKTWQAAALRLSNGSITKAVLFWAVICVGTAVEDNWREGWDFTRRKPITNEGSIARAVVGTDGVVAHGVGSTR